MPGQLQLFDARPHGFERAETLAAVFVTEQPGARRDDPPTSQKAAAAHPVRRGTDRAIALLVLSEHPMGLTDFELAAAMDRQQTSAGKRRLELLRAAPALVEDAGFSRAAPSGAMATVWRLTPAGARLAAELAGEEDEREWVH